MEGLHHKGVDPEQVAALQTDLNQVKASPKLMRLLRLAATLTRQPEAAASLVAPAVSAGWTEAQVAEAIFIVSMYNMVARVAQALAYPPDAGHPFDPAAPLPMLRCEASPPKK